MSSLNLLLSRGWVQLVKSFRYLSMPMRWRLARAAAAVLWFAVPKRRHVILRNLELCFPELSRTERESLAKRVYVRLARAAIDHGTLWCGSAEDVRSLVHFHGIEHLLNPENRTVIVVSPHLAGLDAAGIALNTYVAL